MVPKSNPATPVKKQKLSRPKYTNRIHPKFQMLPILKTAERGVNLPGSHDDRIVTYAGLTRRCKLKLFGGGPSQSGSNTQCVNRWPPRGVSQLPLQLPSISITVSISRSKIQNTKMLSNTWMHFFTTGMLSSHVATQVARFFEY